MDLKQYDRIVINTSAGKDSLAMMDYVWHMAREQGVVDRVIAVHADLGRVEWKGTKELAIEHAAHYAIPIHIVRRSKGDLLEEIEARGKWPSSTTRYCTSYYKRDQVGKLHTVVTDALDLDRPAQILNCMGFRAEESPARAKRKPLSIDDRNTNGRRVVHNWLPIHTWTLLDVWARVKSSGARWHFAYDLGMPRLSCCFCIFAPFEALKLAGQHNPELLTEYVRIERKIGHTFRHKFRIEEVQEALARGESVGQIESWNM